MIAEMSIPATVSMFALLLIPIGIFLYLRIGVVRETIVSAIRMAVQLVLVGLYLKYIFQLNNGWVNLAWVVLMMVAANMSILGKSGLKRRFFFWRTLTGVAASTLIVSGWFILVAIRPEPFYDARYMIPIIGMILGNCQRSNVLSLERFYSGIRKNEHEFMTYLMLGATLREATFPYLRTAIKGCVNPSISTMATMGIVSLPGMMTGQILGGAMPMAAIKYQIGIMICIFTAMVIAAMVNILLSLPVAFDDYQRLKTDIFQ
ncbi:putative iron export permease protein FetB [Pontiella desulfatans]|uniref:Putative iron export permease protein FetB n=1 Tax=Pontiella desulfatans TaxID=2750659 RepID=A0A6C2TXY4_PONDE|nr:ABC transporter permease [Pontiella desulfatans]VGO12294.1 putative iron export permease protein FetB [Pontiella desulfatans]